MVIECIGLPGSGKTYLMAHLEQEIRNRGVRCVIGAQYEPAFMESCPETSACGDLS